MKKSAFIWIVLVVGIIDLLIELGALITRLSGAFGYAYLGNNILGDVGLIVSLAGIVVSIIYLYKLYLLKADILKWTNITFGYSIFTLVFSSIGILINSGSILGAIFANIFSFIITIVIWVFFYRHLKKITNG